MPLVVEVPVGGEMEFLEAVGDAWDWAAQDFSGVRRVRVGRVHGIMCVEYEILTSKNDFVHAVAECANRLFFAELEAIRRRVVNMGKWIPAWEEWRDAR